MAPQGKLHWALALVAIWGLSVRRSFALGGSDGIPASRGAAGDCKSPCVHGFCWFGKCHCQFGYTGPNCSEAVCMPSCQNGGSCIGPDNCLCAPGYTGQACHRADCKSTCVHGYCVSGKCNCYYGSTGPNCSEAVCMQSCQNGGSCIGPNKCLCAPGYSGFACYFRDCKSPCVHGYCISGRCNCYSGYTGPSCSEGEESLSYPTQGNCKESCVNGRCGAFNMCICHSGYSGNWCDERTWTIPVILSCSIGIPVVCIIAMLALILTGCCSNCKCSCKDKKMTPAAVEENVYEDIATISKGIK